MAGAVTGLAPRGRGRASPYAVPRPLPYPVDRGSVTAELAIALPAVVAVLVLALVTTSGLLTQIRCADAARAGARAAALGAELDAVRGAVTAVVGHEASVEVARVGPWVEVRVARRITSQWGPVVASARSTAWVEPVVPGGGPGAAVGPMP